MYKHRYILLPHKSTVLFPPSTSVVFPAFSTFFYSFFTTAHLWLTFTSRKQKIKAYFQLINSMTVMLSITTENTLLTSTCRDNLWGKILRSVENLKGAGWMSVKTLILTKMCYLSSKVVWNQCYPTSFSNSSYSNTPDSFMISLVEFPQLEWKKKMVWIIPFAMGRIVLPA